MPEKVINSRRRNLVPRVSFLFYFRREEALGTRLESSFTRKWLLMFENRWNSDFFLCAVKNVENEPKRRFFEKSN